MEGTRIVGKRGLMTILLIVKDSSFVRVVVVEGQAEDEVSRLFVEMIVFYLAVLALVLIIKLLLMKNHDDEFIMNYRKLVSSIRNSPLNM